MKTVMSNAGAKLLEIVGDMRDASDGHYALHFHLSQLHEEYKSIYQIKIAVNIVNDLFKGQKGVVFVVADNDIVVLYNGSDRTLLEKVIFQLRYLFMDDPLAYSDDGFENEDFCSVYDLEFQWRDFYNICQRKIGRGEGIEPHGKRKRIETPSGKRRKMHLLSPEYLVDIVRDIENTDIAEVINQQFICAAAKGKNVKALYQEYFVGISQLKESLSVDVDLSSSLSLFKYVTKVLDKRMLTFLAEREVDPKLQPISLNLNTRTLLSEDFAAFDTRLSPSQKKNVIIEIAVADLFEDPHRFVIARDAVKKQGYRVCIDSLDYLTFPQISRQDLEFDLAKLKWNPAMASLPAAKHEVFAKAVRKCGSNRIILCRCDDKSALTFGHKMGISLFQGHALDEHFSEGEVAA